MRAQVQARIAAAITFVGLLGVAAMVHWEDEPGALPLAVLLGGIAWWVVAWRRLRRGARRGP